MILTEFNAWFVDNERGLYRFTNALVRRFNLANASPDEIVQQAYVRQGKRVSALIGEEHARASTFVIIRHLIYDCIKRANSGVKTAPLPQIAIHDPSSPDPAEQMELSEAHDVLRKVAQSAITKLSCKERTSLKACVNGCDCNGNDIATALGLSIGAYNMSLSRARATMREVRAKHDLVMAHPVLFASVLRDELNK